MLKAGIGVRIIQIVYEERCIQMNILLAAINAKYIHSNLAVYSLRAYACSYMEETRIAEYTINQPADEILMDIYTRQPDILCFSCYLWNIDYVEQLIREIPKILPETKIWLGGPEVSYNAREMHGAVFRSVGDYLRGRRGDVSGTYGSLSFGNGSARDPRDCIP